MVSKVFSAPLNENINKLSKRALLNENINKLSERAALNKYINYNKRYKMCLPEAKCKKWLRQKEAIFGICHPKKTDLADVELLSKRLRSPSILAQRRRGRSGRSGALRFAIICSPHQCYSPPPRAKRNAFEKGKCSKREE